MLTVVKIRTIGRNSFNKIKCISPLILSSLKLYKSIVHCKKKPVCEFEHIYKLLNMLYAYETMACKCIRVEFSNSE